MERCSSINLRLRLSVLQQRQIHKLHLILSSSALPWFHTGRVRISVVRLISLHRLHHLKEGDKWKAAFSMNQGLFELLVMFFRLCNSPTTFQTMMNDILRPFIDHNEAVCYMDNILIYSPSLMDHQRITWEILQTLHSYKLFLLPEKCKFKHQEVDYLGLVISKDHVAMDPVKVQRCTDWQQPVKVKAFNSFIGFINFFQ